MSRTYTDDDIDRLLNEAYADTESLVAQDNPSWSAPSVANRGPVAPLLLAGTAASLAVAGIVLTHADPGAPTDQAPAASAASDPATADVTVTPEPNDSVSPPRIVVAKEMDRMRLLRMAAVTARFAKAGLGDPAFSAVIGDHDSGGTSWLTVYRVGGATDAARARYGNLDRVGMLLYYQDAVSSAAQRDRVLRAFVDHQVDLRDHGVRLTFLDDEDPAGRVIVGYDPDGSAPTATDRAIFEDLAPGAVRFEARKGP